jgi:hypothetical protein
MDQTCAKCGSPVGDGVAFCPQCKEPQIRVAIAPTPAMDIASAATDWTLGGVSRPAGTSAGSLGIIWQQALPAAAKGGVLSVLVFVIAGLLGGPGLGISMLWGPAFAIGGGLAVFLYRARTHGLPLSAGGGAKIGAASAAFGFAIFAVFLVGTYAAETEPMRKALLEIVGQAASQGYDPQSVQQATDLIKSDSGLAAFVAFSLGVLLFVFLAAGGLGGALCASYLRRR